MSTLRKQTREAIRAKTPAHWPTPTSEMCDAASNIWEPLLQDLLVAYEHAVEHKGAGHRLDDSMFAWGAYIRAKEAFAEDS